MHEKYTKSDIRSILHALKVQVEAETSKDFLCLCPFHNNNNTPSFEVNYYTGLFLCFNPACDERGSLNALIAKITNKNEFEALRFIYSTIGKKSQNIEQELQELMQEEKPFVEFPADKLNELHADLTSSQKAIDYLASRGINKQSIFDFYIGYSEKQDMITIPLTSPDGKWVGIIGRAIDSKEFKNSRNLPRSKTLFNLSSAKKHGGKIIVCESSFDAVRIHQAGFPNVIATLGGHISKENIQNLNKYASSIIIMTDSDVAGRKLGEDIANKLSHKEILWGSYQYGMIYPHEAKDAGDMTDEEIRQCINNAIHHYEYAMV
jgi:DNA primase